MISHSFQSPLCRLRRRAVGWRRTRRRDCHRLFAAALGRRGGSRHHSAHGYRGWRHWSNRSDGASIRASAGDGLCLVASRGGDGGDGLGSTASALLGDDRSHCRSGSWGRLGHGSRALSDWANGRSASWNGLGHGAVASNGVRLAGFHGSDGRRLGNYGCCRRCNRNSSRLCLALNLSRGLHYGLARGRGSLENAMLALTGRMEWTEIYLSDSHVRSGRLGLNLRIGAGHGLSRASDGNCLACGRVLGDGRCWSSRDGCDCRTGERLCRCVS